MLEKKKKEFQGIGKKTHMKNLHREQSIRYTLNIF